MAKKPVMNDEKPARCASKGISGGFDRRALLALRASSAAADWEALARRYAFRPVTERCRTGPS